jgi:hypothetical protein
MNLFQPELASMLATSEAATPSIEIYGLVGEYS